MSFLSCSTLHSSREPTVHSAGGILIHDQGQMSGAELGLMEMTDVEYNFTHLQNLVHMEAEDGSDASSQLKDSTGSTDMSPLPTTQAIDLSTATDDHCLMTPGEKTPASGGEVPGFVLARLRGEKSETQSSASSKPSQTRSRSAARICLEKRFNTMSVDTPRHFLTMLQKSAEAQETAAHLQVQKWKKTDPAHPLEVSSPYGIGRILHMVGTNKHQRCSYNFQIEGVDTKSDEMDKENEAAASKRHASAHCSHPSKAGKTGTSNNRTQRVRMSISQRKERHNSKERERRKRIRLYCDELNVLVPFCDADTDKVTTLKWTTSYLRFINKTYGVDFKEEFQQAFINKRGVFVKSSRPSSQDLFHREMAETSSTPFTAEQ